MENLSHSFAKKSYHGSSGFITTPSKSIYDDVFGGPPKFGVPTLAPRYEDYTEIFGGFHSSRASSIPILDLPVVDDQLSFDVQSCHFDYSEIFGGFNVFDFALPYEDLVRQSTSGYDSSDDAWSPAQSETLSNESEPSAFSERSQSSSSADVHHSSDDTKQFNISYHMTSQSSDGVVSNGMTHVAHLHAIPGYTYMVSGTQASRNTEDEEPPRQPALDLNYNVDVSGPVLEDKQSKRSTSCNMSSSYIMHGSDSKLPEKCSEASRTPDKPFFSVSDISLRTRPSGLPPPSRPPPALASKKEGFDRLNSRLKASNNCASEPKQSDSSQAFFDMDVYASSSAAASSAAIKEAMEKAQAKLRSAKELMERKKQDLKCYSKLHLENGMLEERPSNTFDKDDMEQNMCEGKMEEVFKNNEVNSGNIEGGHFKFTGKSEESEQDKRNMSSQQPYKDDGRVAWREGAEFFEVVETYPSCGSAEKVKNEFGVLHNRETHEYRQSEAATDRLDRLETCKNVVAKEDPDGKEESEEKVGKWSYQWANTHQRSKEEDLCDQLEHHKETVIAEENLSDVSLSEKHVKVQQERTSEKLSSSSHKSVEYIGGGGQNVSERKATVKLSGGRRRLDDQKGFINTDARHIDIELMSEIEEYEGGLRHVIDETGNGQRVNEILKQERKKKPDAVSEREEGVSRWEDNANKPKEDFKTEKNNEKSEVACKQENSERDKEVDFKMDLKDQDANGAFEWEQGDSRFRVALKKKEHEGEKNEAEKGEEIEGRLSGACEGEDGDMEMTEVLEQQENNIESLLAPKLDFENVSEGASELEETEQTNVCDVKWDELREQTEDSPPIELVGSVLKQNTNVEVRKDATALEACQPNYETLFANKMSEKPEENLVNLVTTQSALSCEENERLETELQNCEKESEVELTNLLPKDGCSSVYKRQDLLEHGKDPSKRADAIGSTSLNEHLTDSNGTGIYISKASDRLKKTASEIGNQSDQRNGKPLECLTVNAKRFQSGTNQEVTEEKFTANHSNHRNGTNAERPKVNTKVVQSGTNQEVTGEKFTAHQVAREWATNAKKIGDALAAVLEDVEILSSTDQRAAIGSPQKKERNSNKIITPEAQKTDGRLKKERELEEESMRKLEEEREREREREKDRMSVTREALEKSYLEARGRVERAAMEKAATEMRQRTMAEARERSEKVSAEAWERSSAEQAARLRAERAAVERATAEARKRAFEKAMAEKATLESCERVERSSSEKFSAYSRSTEMRQSSSSEKHAHQSTETSKLRYSYSSAHAGIEGESPQRCKARLERYRRTSERAAKALAEKNMRDLQAQREQTERNRLADTLDAEVKRWSSGKEGNLRALLSTLQYILGPNSGWQPIPLTEVITSAAVKKAYRKATLCVHPDKLQQRGASIHHKYICEKVFDLLKEAWSRFNSEER
ncbi:auxilin-like protein 1 [Lycium ferocissimum]|uniref:auxilin-like protein 1 n=1 Tax=Lycium ferocissimum TaxID=112874 RepID=UPI002815F505|nr:auxilin-like protein 1 [Lycium ferocissimum]